MYPFNVVTKGKLKSWNINIYNMNIQTCAHDILIWGLCPLKNKIKLLKWSFVINTSGGTHGYIKLWIQMNCDYNSVKWLYEEIELCDIWWYIANVIRFHSKVMREIYTYLHRYIMVCHNFKSEVFNCIYRR